MTRQALTFGVNGYGIAATDKNLFAAHDLLPAGSRSAFWLGVFDGDGWVTSSKGRYPRVRIIVEQHAHVLADVLGAHFGLSRVAVYPYSGSSTAVSELSICRKADVSKLAAALLAAYPHSLQRKRKQLQNALEGR